MRKALASMLFASIVINCIFAHEILWWRNKHKEAIADHSRTLDEQNKFLDEMLIKLRERNK